MSVSELVVDALEFGDLIELTRDGKRRFGIVEPYEGCGDCGKKSVGGFSKPLEDLVEGGWLLRIVERAEEEVNQYLANANRKIYRREVKSQGILDVDLRIYRDPSDRPDAVYVAMHYSGVEISERFNAKELIEAIRAVS